MNTHTHTPMKGKIVFLKRFKLVPMCLLKFTTWQTVCCKKSCSYWKVWLQEAVCYSWVVKDLFKCGVLSEGQIHKRKGSVMRSSGIWNKIAALDLISWAQGLASTDTCVRVSNCLPSEAVTASRSFNDLWLAENCTTVNHADHILWTLRCLNTLC